jgi:hypothetical protein
MFLRQMFRRRSPPSPSPSPIPRNSGMPRDFPFAILYIAFADVRPYVVGTDRGTEERPCRDTRGP